MSLQTVYITKKTWVTNSLKENRGVSVCPCGFASVSQYRCLLDTFLAFVYVQWSLYYFPCPSATFHSSCHSWTWLQKQRLPVLTFWPMKRCWRKWVEGREHTTGSNPEFKLTCFSVSLAWPLSNNFSCLLWPIYPFQNSMKKFSHCISKRKMFHLHLEILKSVLSYSIFFLLGMDKVLTLIIGTQIQMEFGKVLIIWGVSFFEDLYIFRGISTLKKLSFVGGLLWRF